MRWWPVATAALLAIIVLGLGAARYLPPKPSPESEAAQYLDVEESDSEDGLLRLRWRHDPPLSRISLTWGKGEWQEKHLLDLAPGQYELMVDVGSSAYAGTRVTVEATGRDISGRDYRAAPIELDLPERYFANDMARAVISARRSLFRDNPYGPLIAMRLDKTSRDIAASGGDLAIYAALRLAHHRLQGDLPPADLHTLAALLWQAALGLERPQPSTGGGKATVPDDSATLALFTPYSVP